MGTEPDKALEASLRAAVAAAQESANKAASSATAAAASASAASADAAIAQDGTKEKRPHRSTLITSWSSVIISGAAMGLAIWTLTLNITSLHVGQRAYIVVRKGSLNISPAAHLELTRKAGNEVPQYQKIKPDSPTYWEARYQFELANLGNSPGKITAMHFSFGLGNDWKIEPSWGALNNITFDQDMKGGTGPTGQDIGPKEDSVLEQFTVQLTIPYKDAAAYRSKPSEQEEKPPVVVFKFPHGVAEKGKLTITGDISYRDVFKDIQTLHWCWNDVIGSDVPLSCVA